MKSRFVTLSMIVVLSFSLISLTGEAKSADPYKALGVDKNASQRDIQKAFHKLSLKYHPDKNKEKGAQAKFEEINNAYEILSDEEKRKNYDLYGDERGNPGFGAGHPGDQGGYYYTSGGQGPNGFNFRPNGWQNMGGKGGSQSYSFSFGGPSSQNSFGFGLNDIFSNLFGGGDAGGSHFGGFGGSGKSQFTSRPGSGRSQPNSQSGFGSSPKSFRNINSKVFKKEIADQGMTWLLLSYNPSLRGSHYHESIIQEVADSLQGAIKVGKINCESEKPFCSELGIHSRQVPRVFIYSHISNEKGSLVEYTGELVAKSLKSFCRDHLPMFSRRIDMKHLESFSVNSEKLPRVLLLSTKKETPVIWRVLSGLYHKRFIFNDAEVHDLTDTMKKKLGVDALPAIVGWLSNGERHVLKSGISVKDLQSAVHDLSSLLDGFEKKNKKVASSQRRKQEDSVEKQIPLLTGDNFDALCGEKHPVCIIGAFRSSKAREKLEAILTKISQQSLIRQRTAASGSRDSISYTLLDASKQQAFLNAFDKSGFKSSDKLLLAYRPRKGKFSTFSGEMNAENVEEFISSIFNGDVKFLRTLEKPMVK